MKIVIVGAGDVGSHLAKLLSNEDQDIVLVDDDLTKLETLNANYNLMTLPGSPTSFKVLREAGAGNCDLFIAVTPYETDNVVACSMAKSLGARRTVARIDNYDFMEPGNRGFVTRMGVDSLIYPEYLAAEEIITALHRSWVRHWFELHDGEIIVVGVKIAAEAPVAGVALRDFTFSHHYYHVSAIKRNHETIIPGGADIMREGDIIYFTTTRDHVEELCDLCGRHQHQLRRVLIMGGGKIAIRLAKQIGPDFKLKIIENNPDVCRSLPEKCPDCDIICGDARDIDMLQEEGVADVDAFVALSDNSEANILTSLTVKEMGVKKTIAEVENIQYISQAEELNISTIINKKLLAAGRIFQLLLDVDSATNKCLALADAEVAELEVKEGAKVTRAAIKDLKLSRDMTIAGLIRDGKGMLVGGNTQLRRGDHVVIFCLQGTLHKMEKLFN